MEIGFQILSGIQALRQPWLDQLMIILSHLGSAKVIWIVPVLLLLYKPTRRSGFCCIMALLLSVLFCNLLVKNIVLRPRPFELRELELLAPPPQDASFPSGHASASFALATGLLKDNPKAAVSAYLLAVLISFSRLYLQVHFPGDVLGGAIMGCGCGFLATWLLGKLEGRRNGKSAA